MCPALHLYGASQGKEGLVNLRGASILCHRSLTPHFAPTDTIVDCPETAESHQGERPEIKADKSAPTCERKHVANESVTFD